MKNESRRGRDYKKFTVDFKMKIIEEIENGVLAVNEISFVRTWMSSSALN